LALAPAALAADMPLKAPPPPPPAPAFSWTGFYIGGNIGYAAEHDSSGTTNFNQPAAVVSTPQSFVGSGSSFAGGVQGGYNMQFAPSWVLGVEGDWDSVKLSSGNFCRTTDNGPPCADAGRGFLNMSETTDWLASVRGRLGWVWNGVLVYGTGGGAWGKVNTTLNATCLVAGCGNNATANATGAAFSTTATGWVAGAGVEGQLVGNWTARLEWLHYSLGGLTNAFTSTPATGTYTVSWTRGAMLYDTVRLGLNYKL
jgi:outer membrane immunogenic protein